MPRRFPRGGAGRGELVGGYPGHVKSVDALFTPAVSRETAEDLAASTCERVVRSWAGFDPEFAGPRTWTMAIARTILADHFRRQSHRNAVSLDEHPALAASLATSDDPAAEFLSR